MAPITLVLKAEDSTLTGAVDRCSVTQMSPTEIHDGRIDGNTITFKCTSPDGDRTVSFIGKVSGDSIAFAWELRVREGGRPPALQEPFGPIPGLAVQPPPRFTANRVPDAVGERTRAAIAKKPAFQPVTFERIAQAEREPQNWLTYSGNLLGHRHSGLTQITPANVKDLELKWLYPQRSAGRFQATPLVVDGVLYTVQAPNDVVALDARTGQFLWIYSYTPPPEAGASAGGGRMNRGLAILGDTLFMGTLDAHLLAINAKSGTLLWNAPVANHVDPACSGPDGVSWCYNITLAPLVVKDKVIVGVGGGDGDTPGVGIRGFIAAFDAKAGKEVWRFYTVPGQGKPGNETWPGDSWKTGGAGVWLTGAYDPELNLTYWGTGNPIPFNGATRRGDNLYSNSVVALDADTGKLRWHYQFMPHDEIDWDAAQIPVLTDIAWQGRTRRVMLWANRNGVFYVFDRSTGEFLMGKPFVAVNWLDGFDDKGRPLFDPARMKAPDRSPAGTNWQSPSYSPRTGWFYVSAFERRASNTGLENSVRAVDPRTGERRWEFKGRGATFFSLLTTASDLLFSGDAGGDFYALDARTGKDLWRFHLPGSVNGGGPIAYTAGGTQYIAVVAGSNLFVFAVRQ